MPNVDWGESGRRTEKSVYLVECHLQASARHVRRAVLGQDAQAIAPDSMSTLRSASRLTKSPPPKNTVQRVMNPTQLAEAERRVREPLNKSRIEPSLSARTSCSDYERGIVV